MKREIAAITFSVLLSGTVLAGPIESSDLAPPAQNTNNANPKSSLDDAKLRGLIEDALNIRKDEKSAQATKPFPQTQAAGTTKPAPATRTYGHEDWNTYSSAELWLDGVPESETLSLDALALRNERNPAYVNVERQDRTVPTAYTWNRGNWKANFGTNVTTATATPTVIPTDVYAANLNPSGGTGAFDGRVEYDANAWQFYGGTKRSIVANADGTLSANNVFSGGTFYNLPQQWLGGKLGTGFEVNPTGDSKTRLEYRQMFGNTEGFLAAERTTPYQHTSPDTSGTNALKAGINRKF